MNLPSIKAPLATPSRQRAAQSVSLDRGLPPIPSPRTQVLNGEQEQFVKDICQHYKGLQNKKTMIGFWFNKYSK